MAFLKKHSSAIAYVLIAIAFAYGLKEMQDASTHRLEVESQRTDQTLYENALTACERGNIIRQVVYRNTLDAIAQDPGAGYQQQLEILQSVPNIDLTDGTVYCAAAISRP